MVKLLVHLRANLSQLLLKILLLGPSFPDLVLDLLGLLCSMLLLLNLLPLLLFHVLHFSYGQRLLLDGGLDCLELLAQLSELDVEPIDVAEEALSLPLCAVDLVYCLLDLVLDRLQSLLGFSLLPLVLLAIQCLGDDELLFRGELLDFSLGGLCLGLKRCYLLSHGRADLVEDGCIFAFVTLNHLLVGFLSLSLLQWLHDVELRERQRLVQELLILK